jgi:hypothetical protein
MRPVQSDQKIDGNRPIREGGDTHEWIKLKCANGAIGWIFIDEARKAPGFSDTNLRIRLRQGPEFPTRV